MARVITMILTNEERIQREVLGEIGFYNQIALFDDLCTAVCRLEDDMGKYAVFLCDAQEQHLTSDSKVIIFPNKMEYMIWEQSICADIHTAIESIINHNETMEMIEQQKAQDNE